MSKDRSPVFAMLAALYGNVPEFPLRLAGIGAHARPATDCASDCSKKTFGRRVVRPGMHAPGKGRAGYVEIFGV